MTTTATPITSSDFFTLSSSQIFVHRLSNCAGRILHPPLNSRRSAGDSELPNQQKGRAEPLGRKGQGILRPRSGQALCLRGHEWDDWHGWGDDRILHAVTFYYSSRCRSGRGRGIARYTISVVWQWLREVPCLLCSRRARRLRGRDQ